jgi:hypothetical protein
MRFARFSIADLLFAVGLCAVSMACLVYASTPWAAAVLSIALAALVLSLIGIIYRRGERRAFWVGFAICGWAYITLSSGPWFDSSLRYQLATSRLLEWAYPLLIPLARQAENRNYVSRPFVVPPASLEGGLTVGDLSGMRVDVFVQSASAKSPSLLVEDVPTAGESAPGPSEHSVSRTNLMVDRDQFERLTQAKAQSQKFILRPVSPRPLEPLWSSPPVHHSEFQTVGHALFSLLFAWIGSITSRYFYATHDTAT